MDTRTAWSTAWGVVAGIFGAGAIAWYVAAAPNDSHLPTWPAIALVIGCLIGLYCMFAALLSKWPFPRFTSATDESPSRRISGQEEAEILPQTETASTRGRIPPFGFPLVRNVFVGRGDELEALHEALKVADHAVVSKAIIGLDGVGKSRLAAEFVRAHNEEYDVVAWIRAEDGGIADLADFARELSQPIEGLSPKERADAALDWLTRTDCRWLLVLDNVEAPEDLEACMPRFGGGRVIVTSRNRAVAHYVPALPLGPFKPSTAIDYLVRQSRRANDRESAARLAEALGYLPLALSHAGAYCANGTSFDDYLSMLESLPARELFDINPESSYTDAIASTWKPSIEAAKGRAPLAADVLHISAYFAPDGIPKALFARLIDVNSASESKQLRDAFSALAQFSLATVGDDSIDVHRLLQKVVRDDGRARNDRQTPLFALDAIDNAFPSDIGSPPEWSRCELLLPHVLALTKAFDNPGDAEPRVLSLLSRASRYLLSSGGTGRALAVTQYAVKRAALTVGQDDPSTLLLRNEVATAYQRDGQTNEAIALFKSTLVDCERILGPDDDVTLIVGNNLGLAYRLGNKNEDAISILEPLLVHREKEFGRDHPATLAVRNNLALAYASVRGREEEALAAFEAVLADSTRVFGPEHPNTLATRSNVAAVYRAAGRIDDAIDAYVALRADTARILGLDHPDALATRRLLGNTYREKRRLDDAIAVYEPLLADSKRVFGVDHPTTLAIKESLVSLYRADGNAAKAAALVTDNPDIGS